MTITEIVVEWLGEKGYDGLYCDECGCLADDLMPCGSEGALYCEPGYKRDAPEGSEFNFVVGARKQGETE